MRTPADTTASSASSPSAPRTARDRARAEITAEILAAARGQLAELGAAGLSLRAIARDLGMASSAVYRYVPSRDDLLTRLIVEGYDALGVEVEQVEGAVPREDLSGRFHAVARGVRDWALAHPHEYALLYGTPVPGYRAPEDTIAPATRVPMLLVRILIDAVAAGLPVPDAALPPEVRTTIDPLRDSLPEPVPDDVMLRGLLAWSALFGAVSFELFGHLHNVVEEDPDDRACYFHHQVGLVVSLVGLPAGPAPA